MFKEHQPNKGVSIPPNIRPSLTQTQTDIQTRARAHSSQSVAFNRLHATIWKWEVFILIDAFSYSLYTTRFFIYKHQQHSTEPGWFIFKWIFPSFSPYPYPYLWAKNASCWISCMYKWMDCYRIDRNTDFLKKIGPNFRLAVLIAVVLINKKACIVFSYLSYGCTV